MESCSKGKVLVCVALPFRARSLSLVVVGLNASVWLGIVVGPEACYLSPVYRAFCLPTRDESEAPVAGTPLLLLRRMVWVKICGECRGEGRS